MKGTLLLVDDDRDDVDLILLGFRRYGFDPELTVAADGLQAFELLLQACDAGRALPAVILTDLKMPRMDGFELLRRLKGDSRLRDLPVLVLTSSGYHDDMSEALRLGAARYMRKPANLDDYAEIVTQVREVMQVRPSR